MMKTKITITKMPKKYLDLPFIVIDNEGLPYMIYSDDKKIKVLNLETGTAIESYESLDEYFNNNESDKIVPSEIIINKEGK